MQTPLDRMADFDLTEEQREVRRMVREFAEKEILLTSSVMSAKRVTRSS